MDRKLETAMVRDTIGKLSQERGAENELFAQKVCSDLVASGLLIECFWAIPKNSRLDHRGIDIIVKTSRGYYFLNVKSSMAGVESFRQSSLQPKNIKENILYPWRVVRQNGPAEAEHSLKDILGDAPSCGVLPQELDEVAHLTPNSVLANSAPPGLASIGKHQQRVLDQIATDMRLKVQLSAEKKLREKEREPLATLSTSSLNWHSRLHKVGLIKKWDFSAVEEGWMAEIEVEVFGTVVRGTAVSNKKKKAETSAAEMVAEGIRKMKII